MTHEYVIIGNGGHSKGVADILNYALGIGGITIEALENRLEILRNNVADGRKFPAIIHPTTSISPSAKIGQGVHIMAMCSVGANVEIGEGAIINTGAIIEHGAVIGAGSHIAPRAVVLGDAIVEKCTFVGAGSVVIQGTRAKGFIKALTISNGERC